MQPKMLRFVNGSVFIKTVVHWATVASWALKVLSLACWKGGRLGCHVSTPPCSVGHKRKSTYWRSSEQRGLQFLALSLFRAVLHTPRVPRPSIFSERAPFVSLPFTFGTVHLTCGLIYGCWECCSGAWKRQHGEYGDGCVDVRCRMNCLAVSLHCCTVVAAPLSGQCTGLVRGSPVKTRTIKKAGGCFAAADLNKSWKKMTKQNNITRVTLQFRCAKLWHRVWRLFSGACHSVWSVNSKERQSIWQGGSRHSAALLLNYFWFAITLASSKCRCFFPLLLFLHLSSLNTPAFSDAILQWGGWGGGAYLPFPLFPPSQRRSSPYNFLSCLSSTPLHLLLCILAIRILLTLARPN